MTYKHVGMPPVIRRTADDHHQLESQGGTVIAEYDRANMSHPQDWWTDLFNAMRVNYDDPMEMAHDLTLLATVGDWEFVDDR